jgi:hypothetical protein
MQPAKEAVVFELMKTRAESCFERSAHGFMVACRSPMPLRSWLRRVRHGSPIVVVSGLPRSGTSMAMRMLLAGGVPILTDGQRAADVNNPEGYFEFEPVKGLDKGGEQSWLLEARGKAVKIVSWLLTWLPESYEYQVVFMERDLDEVIASQTKMLRDRGEEGAASDAETLKATYAAHLEQVHRFLDRRRCFSTLRVGYRDAIAQPAREAERLATFVGQRLDVDRMAAAVDPGLYRNRRGQG